MLSKLRRHATQAEFFFFFLPLPCVQRGSEHGLKPAGNAERDDTLGAQAWDSLLQESTPQLPVLCHNQRPRDYVQTGVRGDILAHMTVMFGDSYAFSGLI